MSLPRSFSLLTPLLWGAAIFFLLLAVRSVLQSRSSCKRWDMETIEWGRPRPSLLQRWRTKMGRIRFRLPGFAKQRMSEIAPQPVLPLFDAPSGKPQEGFAWEETKGIE